MAKPEAMVQLGDLVKVTTHTGWRARQEWYVREVKEGYTIIVTWVDKEQFIDSVPYDEIEVVDEWYGVEITWGEQRGRHLNFLRVADEERPLWRSAPDTHMWRGVNAFPHMLPALQDRVQSGRPSASSSRPTQPGLVQHLLQVSEQPQQPWKRRWCRLIETQPDDENRVSLQTPRKRWRANVLSDNLSDVTDDNLSEIGTN
jgi:hypothetical protein